MASITVFLRTDYKKDDNIYPVYLSFRLSTGKRIRINTGVTCGLEEWNENKRIIKGRSIEVKDKNLIISNDVAFINDIFVKYKLNHQELTETLFQREWENRAASSNIITYIEKRAETKLLNKDISKSTYISQKTIATDLRKFKNPIPFYEVEIDLLKRFRVFLSDNGNSVNTIDKKMRQLHAYFADAIKDKLLQTNPIDLLDKKTTDVDVDYLDEEDLKKLFVCYASGEISPTERAVLRKFLFACLTGFRISDAKSVAMSNIKNGYLVKQMVKTARTSGRSTFIPITKSIQRLINDANPEGIPGLIFNDGLSDQHTNRYLKTIAIKAKLSKKISFKTGRHTFGYIYYKKTKDLLALKALMGHSKIEQTLVYSHLNDDDIISGMNSFDTFTLEE